MASLFGCASGPSGTSEPKPRATPAAGSIERDGPEAIIPPGLAQVPDATPKLEPVRKGGPNKPYEVFGQRYEPMTEDLPLVERGLASWYGKKFHGRPTSSGEIYNMYAMTGAHATMPIPGYARVRNPANGREVLVRINDRGPFHRGRIIDLSYTAALKLDILRGVSPVEVERITLKTSAAAPGSASARPKHPRCRTHNPSTPRPARPVPRRWKPPSKLPRPARLRLKRRCRRPPRPPRAASGCRSGPFRAWTAPRPCAAMCWRSWPGWRPCWQCSRTAACTACRPAPMPRAKTPAEAPSSSEPHAT